jgi:hypothetical protein
MPNGQITRFIPGRGLVVIGFKVPDAGVVFKHTPGRGLCPIQTGQLKNAKETFPVTSCLLLSIIQRINALLFGNNPTEYFDQLDAILQSGSNTLIPLSVSGLSNYYNQIDGRVPATAIINVFSGTVFQSSILNPLVGTNSFLLIPSRYSISIGGDAYQGVGSGPTATLTKNGVVIATALSPGFLIGSIALSFISSGPSFMVQVV